MYELKISKDLDAKVDHKNAGTYFFGYKTHIAISDERIIISAVVTSGEKHDGKYLETLVKKSREAGMEVDEVIGDADYSKSDNIELANTDDNLKLYSRLSGNVSEGVKPKQKVSSIIKMPECMFVLKVI